MAVWTVWEHDRHDGDARIENAVFVRDGFSWLAFLVPPIWCLANGMIVVFIAVAVAGGAAVMAAQLTLGGGLASLFPLALALWFGFEAHALKRWAMARRGWTLAAVVEARRFPVAERRYVTDRLSEAAAPSSPPAGTPPPLPSGYGAGNSGGGLAGTSDGPVLGVFPEGTR